jgi:hypothetical protein
MDLFSQQELKDHLSADDLPKFAECVGTIFQPVTDSQGSGSALQSAAPQSSDG